MIQCYNKKVQSTIGVYKLRAANGADRENWYDWLVI